MNRLLIVLIKPLELVKLPVAYFYVSHRQRSQKSSSSNILYFESNNRKVTVAKINGRDSFYGKLNSICQEVEDRGFLAIHKSYLVNYLHIESCRSTDVTMDNGEILPISRARQKGCGGTIDASKTGRKESVNIYVFVSLFCTLLQTYVLYRYYLIFFS